MRQTKQMLVVASLIPFLLLGLLGKPPVFGAKIRTSKIKRDKAYTFYLTGNRICRKCYWRHAENGRVELSNKAGITATYDRSELIGVDNHPIFRRLFRKGIHGVGLPGRVIVPTAFDDEKHIDHP